MIHFEYYNKINSLINMGEMAEARSQIIQLLDKRTKLHLPNTEILNHLIREVGLFPYIDFETAVWEDVFAASMFRTNTSMDEYAVLHIEQSYILKRLLQGESLAVSAPTSFGKSYIIDSFIAIKKPNCVVIIVPTIALANETRRRISKKFSKSYTIITTSDEVINDKSILILPQERAFSYLNVLKSIDILIVDEFYKAALKDERAQRLLNVMVELGKCAKQKYYLGPNIDHIVDNPFTAGMQFVSENDFKTVVTKRKNEYLLRPNGQDNLSFKRSALIRLLTDSKSKALIYAASHPQVNLVCDSLIKNLQESNSELCISFANWLTQNYGTSCFLIPLIKRGVGTHNGNLHRSLAQIQIKLFEETNGLDSIVSTSSIIEGVNTQAERVILWNNKIGGDPLDYFTYRNIIGRAGRMFKYFIGYVYLLEEAPKEKTTQIELPLTDEVVCNLDDSEPGISLNAQQKKKLLEYNNELKAILGIRVFNQIKNNPSIKGVSPTLVLRLARKIVSNRYWPLGFSSLASDNTFNWRQPIEDIFIELKDSKLAKRVNLGLWIFSDNWHSSIPQLVQRFEKVHIKASDIFKLERDITYKIPSILSVIYTIKSALYEDTADIRQFIKRATNAFLPKNVYELEEYGLPRMLSKKIHNANLINLEDEDIPISKVIKRIKEIGLDIIISKCHPLHPFDIYILKYFFDGI